MFAALLLTGCGARHDLPPRHAPPAAGQRAEIGVPYGVTVSCPVPIELGGAWWSFDQPIGTWPADISQPPFPFSIWAGVTSPYPVPGIVTLTDADTAIFRADVDGSEFALSANATNPEPGAACL